MIVLDLKLPKISGLEVLKRVKTDPRTQAIPVVLLTSSHEEQDLNMSYSLGANAYLVKPVKFDDLVKIVEHLIGFWVILNKLPLSTSLQSEE